LNRFEGLENSKKYMIDTYENPNELKEVSSNYLIENFISNIEEDYPAEMTESEKLKYKKGLENLAEILMEEYGDL